MARSWMIMQGRHSCTVCCASFCACNQSRGGADEGRRAACAQETLGRLASAQRDPEAGLWAPWAYGHCHALDDEDKVLGDVVNLVVNHLARLGKPASALRGEKRGEPPPHHLVWTAWTSPPLATGETDGAVVVGVERTRRRAGQAVQPQCRCSRAIAAAADNPQRVILLAYTVRVAHGHGARAWTGREAEAEAGSNGRGA